MVTTGLMVRLEARAEQLKAGVPYRFVVNDKSSPHDVHLTGPALSKVITGVAYAGTTSVALRLRRAHTRSCATRTRA